jgi:outer membrane protein with beta-barrel domain
MIRGFMGVVNRDRAACPAVPLLLVAALAAGATPVFAGQSGPAPAVSLPRFDAAFHLGRSHVREDGDEFRYERGYGVADGTASAGFYWTEHVKTDVEVTWASEGDLTGSTTADVPGVPADFRLYTRNRYRTRTLSIGQSYQFFHNAWFHPFVTAGAALGWQRERVEVPEQRYYPATVFTPGVPAERIPVVIPARPIETSSRIVRQAFAGAGLKAYITPRAFFRSDLRFAVGSDGRTNTIRFGFGLDF